MIYRTLCLGIAFALGQGASQGALPVINLDTLLPPGGKAGGEVEVTVTGSELDEPAGLIFSHPGISAKWKADKTFVVTIPAEVPAGVYDARMIGKSGLSNPRAFAVGVWPEVVEKVANDKIETAVELAPNSTFNGILAASSSDYFKFNAKEGQRCFFQCEAPAIDSRLNPKLSVFDGSGRELAVSRRDGFIDFTAPAGGTYFIRLHDLTYAGGAEFFYRLNFGDAPHLDFVMPPCVPAGTKTKVMLYGRGLPGSSASERKAANGKPLEKLEVEIDAPVPGIDALRVDGLPAPAAASLDGFSYRFRATSGASNAVFIGFASAAVVLEQEPNNQTAQAQKVSVPCEIAGQFQAAADTDCYQFNVKKGEAIWAEVVSHRMAEPTNPFLVIERPGGGTQEIYGTDANVGGLRFSTSTNDPSGKIETPEDGAYTVKVRDLFGGTRADPSNVYRLILRRESPDFRLAAVSELQPKNNDDRSAVQHALVLRGGETNALRVVALRRDGFAGDIELRAEGLPPGVSCTPTRILAGKADGYLLFTAAEKAERWSGPIEILGKAKMGDAEVVHAARGGAVEWRVADANTEPIVPRLTRDCMLAVVNAETAPISIEAAEDKVWEAPSGGKLEVPLKIARRGGFEEALKLKAFGAPALDGMKELDIDPKASTATATIDLNAVKIPAGAYTFYFRALTKGKFRNKETTTEVYSTPIRFVVR